MAAEPLTLSRAELTALLFKAARGAGVPLAHAEDLARAVGRYGTQEAVGAALRSLEAPWQELELTAADDVLTISPARAIQALPHALEALAAGFREVRLPALDEPALLPCYLAGQPATMRGEALIAAQAQPAKETSRDPAHQPSTDQLSRLEALAALTYVPASATSREGAGAGADQD